MKNDRPGDWLWEEWDGDPFLFSENDLAYFTYEWVDLDNDVVKRALASCLQRDGVVDSLSEGFKACDSVSFVDTGYCGVVDGEESIVMCNNNGETPFGDFVLEVKKITLVHL